MMASGDIDLAPRPRMDVLKALPSSLGVDAVIAMNPENFTYASGVFVLTMRFVRARQAYVVFPAAGEPVVIACGIDGPQIKEATWIDEVRTYEEFVEQPVDILIATIRDLGLEKGRIGIDFDYLPAATFQTLTRALPEASFLDTSAELAAIRSVKTRQEIAVLERNAKLTHRAVLDAMASSVAGESERVIANRIATQIIEHGADTITWISFPCGNAGKQTHGHPSDRPVEPGEIIRFDVGGTYGAWASDFARTYSSGSPTAEQRDVYAKLVDIQAEVIGMMKPGVVAQEVFAFCKKKTLERGLPFLLPHIGHSFGIEIHERPLLRPGEEIVLEEGMVLNVEPLTSDGQGIMYHVEDLVEITGSGTRILSLGLALRELPVIGEPVSG